MLSKQWSSAQVQYPLHHLHRVPSEGQSGLSSMALFHSLHGRQALATLVACLVLLVVNSPVSNSQAMPPASVSYTRHTADAFFRGDVTPYLMGGIQRPECAACKKPGTYPKFCLFKPTGRPYFDEFLCPASAQNRTLDFLAGLQRLHARTAPPGVPGPAELTPLDLFESIRGRTLWFIGDSHGIRWFRAAQCFMMELWDTNTMYNITDGLEVSVEPHDATEPHDSWTDDPLTRNP